MADDNIFILNVSIDNNIQDRNEDYYFGIVPKLNDTILENEEGNTIISLTLLERAFELSNKLTFKDFVKFITETESYKNKPSNYNSIIKGLKKLFHIKYQLINNKIINNNSSKIAIEGEYMKDLCQYIINLYMNGYINKASIEWKNLSMRAIVFLNMYGYDGKDFQYNIDRNNEILEKQKSDLNNLNNLNNLNKLN